MSVWETLSKIDVSSYVESKNGFTYLSWAHAWREIKNIYPQAVFKKHRHEETGTPVFMDHNGNAYVVVTVVIKTDDEIADATEVFPVLSSSNKPVQNPNAFEVNKALQRGLTKAMAYLGLGFYIYAGEDLPEGDEQNKAPRPQRKLQSSSMDNESGW